MTIPNLITLIRLALTIVGLVFVALWPENGESLELGAFEVWVPFSLFMFAAVTDFVDGYLARSLGQVSVLGRILDPLADKILIAGGLILLIPHSFRLPGLLPTWLVVIVVSREILVSSIRGMIESQGKSFAADGWGKWKMVTQCFYLEALMGFIGGWAWCGPVAEVSLWVVLVLTTFSALNYFKKAYHALVC
jgi:CDP-diacylglycerol--glycerol-3-phosphate 3-phosphatidyltransferase